MKQILAQGYPVIVLVYWMPEMYSGDHYRVVVGYDDAEGVLLINDGWSREFKSDHDYQGSTSQSASENAWDTDFVPLKWKYEDFLDTWTCDTSNWGVPGLMYGGVFCVPWEVEVTAPSTVVCGGEVPGRGRDRRTRASPRSGATRSRPSQPSRSTRC